MISHVPPESVNTVWASLEPMIKKGLSHGQGDGSSGEPLKQAVINGESMMWVVHEGEHIKAGIVLSVLDGETGKSVFIELLAGNRMHEWVDEVEELLQRYRDYVGAKCIEASCRPGLAKRLMERGWKRKAIVVEL